MAKSFMFAIMLTLGFINASTELPDYLGVIEDMRLVAYAGHYSSAGEGATGCRSHENTRYDDFRKFLNACDAVIIPHVDNPVYPLIVNSLKQSKHVLLGNPLKLGQDEMDHLFKLAEEANVVIRVIQHVKCNGALKKAAEHILNPAYLEVRIDSPGNNQTIFDSVFYAIQPVVSINPSNLKKLHAVSIPMKADHPGMVNARIEFDNGCVANITSSKFAGTNRFYCRIHQKEKDILIDFIGRKVTLIGSAAEPETGRDDPTREELEHFITGILSRNILVNQSESGYLSYLISRKIMEKISLEALSA